jgi:hypothetical protein
MNKKMERAARELEDLKLHNLRSIAATYLMEFLHAVSRLIEGTSEGMPSLYGSTSEEERQLLGEWIDAKKDLIKVKRKWKLPYLDIKLYGGQQFERLLSEFKMVRSRLHPQANTTQTTFSFPFVIGCRAHGKCEGHV